MELQIIKTDKEYQNMLECVDSQFDLNLNPQSTAGEHLQISLSLIK